MPDPPAAAPRRLTRDEAAARTRELLLDSARTVFVERGYQNSSIYEIAARAGRTIGALYAHFGGKEGVYLAVWERHSAEVLERYAALVATAADGTDVPPAAGAEVWVDILQRDPDMFRLFIEFWSQALRDPELRDRFARWLRELNGAVTAIIENYQRATGLSSPVPARDAALVFEALVDGFSLHRLADPDRVDDALLSRAFTWLTQGLLAEARQRPPR